MSKTIKNTRGHPEDFKTIIKAKICNFIGRKFVFSAINNFINQYDKGYFTIVGEPGGGKSAIAAQYFNNNNNVVYYNFDIAETTLTSQSEYETFLEIVNNQLLEILSRLETNQLDNKLENNDNLFSLLLQKISDKSTRNQPLVIIVDGCHKLDQLIQKLLDYDFLNNIK